MKSHGLFRFAVGLLALALVLGVAAPAARAQGDGPRTITDVMGREVTLDSAPQRVVGMSASITEVLYAIGITPVGATEDIDYPEAAASLPTFGSGYQPDLEALAALEPDLIIANAQLNGQIMDQLEAIAPTVAVLILTPADVAATIRLVGQATWHETAAEYLAHAYDSLLSLVQEEAPADGPSVLIVVGTLATPNYGKSSTYLGDMVTMLGGTVVGDDQPDAGPFPGYAQLSVEQILDADPDVILTITRGAPGATCRRPRSGSWRPIPTGASPRTSASSATTSPGGRWLGAGGGGGRGGRRGRGAGPGASRPCGWFSATRHIWGC